MGLAVGERSQVHAPQLKARAAQVFGQPLVAGKSEYHCIHAASSKVTMSGWLSI